MRHQHQIELSKTIHQCLDQVEALGEEFIVQDCLAIALQHWDKVRETELTMSKPTDKAGGPATSETSKETQPKKTKKNKPKGTTTDQSGTTPTVTKEKAPATTPKDPPIPTPSYYFWFWGQKSHLQNVH